MRIKFWGTRGSIPTPGRHTIKYGGNTSCVEVRTAAGELIIIDAGSGIRNLGISLMKEDFGKGSGEGHILFSHTHWDHIQGFPFFVPGLTPGNHFALYGENKADKRLEDTLAGQMEHPYFPIRLRDMASEMEFVEVKNGDRFSIGSAEVLARSLNHPNGVFGYRISADGRAFAYASDTEHYPDRVDEAILEIAMNADALAYDSQYTPEEYGKKVGWGHSTAQEGLKVAEKAKVKRLILFHHDPTRSDDAIDEILENCKKDASEMGLNIEIIAAYDGLEISL
ncbi:MAG: MBL fold metallo-hydrolase [bacterium]